MGAAISASSEVPQVILPNLEIIQFSSLVCSIQDTGKKDLGPRFLTCSAQTHGEAGWVGRGTMLSQGFCEGLKKCYDLTFIQK